MDKELDDAYQLAHDLKYLLMQAQRKIESLERIERAASKANRQYAMGVAVDFYELELALADHDRLTKEVGCRLK